jgi:nitrous oxidase accessory protein NosD
MEEHSMKWKLLVFVLLLAVGMARPARARTWYVKADGTGDAPTIQAAIDSATGGDIVLVAPGTYDDTTHVQVGDSLEVVNVHLYKNVKLRAEGDPSNTTIGWSESDIAIYVSGVDSTAEIRGFRIETTFRPYACLDGAAAPAEPDFQFGIKCDDASLAIRDNDIVNHGVCVNLVRSPARIEGNTIHLGSAGVRCYEESDAVIQSNELNQCGGGILCDQSTPEILDNMMDNICTAIYCTTGGSAHLAGNLITGMRTHAISVGEAAPLIEENEFRGNSTGIYIISVSHTPVVRNNVIYHTGAMAIHLSDTPSAIIENNTIDLVLDGVLGAIGCQAGSNPIVRSNIITRAPTGMMCLLSSNPTFECNTLFDVQSPWAGDCSDQTGINGNISVDPQFCGIADSGNYFLQSDSPCAPGNHPDGYDCGQIGARGVGCGNTPVSKATWGSLKALFQKEESK